MFATILQLSSITEAADDAYYSFFNVQKKEPAQT